MERRSPRPTDPRFIPSLQHSSKRTYKGLRKALPSIHPGNQNRKWTNFGWPPATRVVQEIG